MDGGRGAEASISNISSWTFCDLDSVKRMYVSTCVFDPELYAISERTLGFDICPETFEDGVSMLEGTDGLYAKWIPYFLSFLFLKPS